MTEEERQEPPENGRKTYGLKVSDFVAAGIAVVVIPTWLILASLIVYGAIRDPEVLDNIEGLLTALAVLTIATVKIIDETMRKWLGGD